MAADIKTLIAAAARRYGVDPATLTRIAEIESGLNPNARNPRSSAGGLFQVIDSTAADYGLANRFDPAAASDTGARIARDSAAYLTKMLGRAPTGAEIYLAHQQGRGGAGKLLANPNVPAAAVVGDKAVLLNGGKPGMTASEFAGLWLNKFGGAPSAPAAVGSPSIVEQMAGPLPAEPPTLAGALALPKRRAKPEEREDAAAAEDMRRRALLAVFAN